MEKVPPLRKVPEHRSNSESPSEPRHRQAEKQIRMTTGAPANRAQNHDLDIGRNIACCYRSHRWYLFEGDDEKGTLPISRQPYSNWLTETVALLGGSAKNPCRPIRAG
jgi:hypothetical protein